MLVGVLDKSKSRILEEADDMEEDTELFWLTAEEAEVTENTCKGKEVIVESEDSGELKDDFEILSSLSFKPSLQGRGQDLSDYLLVSYFH